MRTLAGLDVMRAPIKDISWHTDGVIELVSRMWDRGLFKHRKDAQTAEQYFAERSKHHNRKSRGQL
jgi:hypothetical protein